MSDVLTTEQHLEARNANLCQQIGELVATQFELLTALRALSFAAQTSGGVAGRDDVLITAIKGAAEAIARAPLKKNLALHTEIAGLHQVLESIRRKTLADGDSGDILAEIRDMIAQEIST